MKSDKKIYSKLFEFSDKKSWKKNQMVVCFLSFMKIIN